MTANQNAPSLETQTPSTGAVDLGAVINDAQKNLLNEKPKRHRRTKAEIQAAGGSGRVGSAPLSTPQVPGLNPQMRDRTAELKPAFALYSEIFLAKPLEIPELKFSDTEAENLARVTSDLMNAFPEYFNNSNPQVGALISAAIVAAPIGYTKYMIYKEVTEKRELALKKKEHEPR